MVCYVGLVYPRPRFGLLSSGGAVRDEPAQYISMRAPETTAVVPNGVTIVTPNYECGFGRSTALFSSARSRLTSRISPWCATLVWSTHGLVSAFFHVGRQFGTSRPNTLACGLRKRPWSFLMGVTIVTPKYLIYFPQYRQVMIIIIINAWLDVSSSHALIIITCRY